MSTWAARSRRRSRSTASPESSSPVVWCRRRTMPPPASPRESSRAWRRSRGSRRRQRRARHPLDNAGGERAPRRRRGARRRVRARASPRPGKVRRRTSLAGVELSPGRKLPASPVFFDVTDGLSPTTCDARSNGSSAKGSAPFRSPRRSRPTTIATSRPRADRPGRGSAGVRQHRVVRLYGLELRAVTAAVNASILPIAVRTAEFVEHGVRDANICRRHGDPRRWWRDRSVRFSEAPAKTLYSGPAASVAGALRSGAITDGVIVEVGGTSTNVAAIRDGRPLLSYVRWHLMPRRCAPSTSEWSVSPVARCCACASEHVHAVGPRSAHIAGLPYACFLEPQRLVGAQCSILAPREGDEADHVVLELTDGSRAAVTVTCAANALGVTQSGDHAWSPTSHEAASRR